MSKIIIAMVGLALAGIGVNANAVVVNSGTNLIPSLTITSGCTVSVSSNVAFPNTLVNIAAGTVITSVIGTVLVAGECKKYDLGADAGMHYTTVRHLDSGVSGVSKILYRMNLSGAGTLANWGTVGMPTTPAKPTTAGGQTAYHNNRATPKGSADVYTITGEATIPVGVVTTGTYTDTVAVIIEF